MQKIPTIAISCVVDDHPKFLMQGWNWLCSLRMLGAQERARVIIHYTEGLDAARLTPFR